MDATDRAGLKLRLLRSLTGAQATHPTDLVSSLSDAEVVHAIEDGPALPQPHEAALRMIALELRAQSSMWSGFGPALRELEKSYRDPDLRQSPALRGTEVALGALELRWYLATNDRAAGESYAEELALSHTGYLYHLAHTALGVWRLSDSGPQHLSLSARAVLDSWLLSRGPARVLRRLVFTAFGDDPSLQEFDGLVARWRAQATVPHFTDGDPWC